MILDKTQENIRRLKEKLSHPITTKIYSTYPIYSEPDIHQLNNQSSKNKLHSYKNLSFGENLENPVSMPMRLNQYWNPKKQEWISPNYSRKPSRNEIARELLSRKYYKKIKKV